MVVSARQVRSKLGLDAPDDDKDVFGLKYPQSLQATSALNKSLSVPVRRDMVDELNAEELSDWQPLVKPLVSDIEAVADKCIAEGKSLADFQKELLNIQTKPEALVQSLAKVSMAVRLKEEGRNE